MGARGILEELSNALEDSPLHRTGIAILSLLALAVLLIMALADARLISLAFMADNASFLLVPALTSVAATMISFAVGILGAIPMGLVRSFGPRLLKQGGLRAVIAAPLYGGVTSYVEAIRGTPALVQIFLVSQVSGIIFPGNPNIPFWGGVLALTLNTLGYQSEVFRAGFQSVNQNQIEAAKAIGMRPRQAFAYVTLPQGIRLITLPLVNEWVGLFKASALLGVIAVPELNWAAGYLGSTRSHPIEAFLMVSAAYLAIIIPLSKAVGYWERTHRIPGLGTPEPGRGRRAGLRRPVPAR